MPVSICNMCSGVVWLGFQLDLLKSIITGHVSMKVNTARL